jgi:uncharacterized protein YkwD
MSRGTRRVRFLLPGALVLAVLFDSGCGASSSSPAPGPASANSPATSQSGLAVAASPTVVTAPARHATPNAHRSTARPSGSASSSATHPAAAAPATTHATAHATAPAASSASAGTPAAQNGTAAAQVLALINQARAAAGRPALAVTSGLDASSSAHNMRMASGCGLSHQCPGEAALGDRETAAGVHWTAAGENIGEGGPVAGTTTAVAQMAVGLTQSMLNEQPPDDGHRMNILSSSYTHIGIAVYRDSSGTVWLTQDFSS